MPGPIILDVRDDVRAGREPFHRIMAAVAALRPEQELVVINFFEPRPLYKVLAAHGFGHRVEETEEGDWRVTFFRHDGPDDSAGLAAEGT